LHKVSRYKIYPEKEVGRRIRDKELAIINLITHKNYSIFYLKEGSHGR